MDQFAEWVALGERLRGIEPRKFAEVVENLREVTDALEAIAGAMLSLGVSVARIRA